MHDPRQPADSPDFSSLAGHGGEKQQAQDAVRAVVAWYNTQITQERRGPVPDEDRVEELKAGRQAALEDQRRLETSGSEEQSRIAALYATRLRELRDS